MRLRSPRLPAEAGRAIVLGTAILAGGCEAVFGPPSLISNADSTGGEGFDPAPEDAFTSEAGREADTGHGAEEAADDESAEVGGGELEGPASFDLGHDSGSVPPPDNPGECCSPGMGVGCSDDAIEACVCAIDPACCEAGWDELCAKHVEVTGCGACGTGVQTKDFPFDCCAPHEGPGCLDEVVASCVCETDPFCCMVGWDQVCVDTGIDAGCVACLESLFPTETNCCAAQAEAGCDDPEIAACVCATDATCCDAIWDELCAEQVEALGCGECGPPDAPSIDCCTDSTLPGCGDAAIEPCVCGADPYCCMTAWDAVCVNEVEGLACGSCTSVGSTGDDYGTSGGVDPIGTTSDGM